MRQFTQSIRTKLVWMLLFLLLAVAVTGCSTQVAAETTTQDPGYTGTLDTSYENALDPISQLALGTLNVEGTASAVTGAQAVTLLPLWQALQANDLQGTAERYAAAALIETVMTEEQILSIASMQLTQADLQAWSQNKVPTAGTPALDGNAVPVANVSDEDQSAQFGGANGGPQGLIAAVVDLLSAQGNVDSDAAASPSSESTTSEPSVVDGASTEVAVVETSPESEATDPASDTSTTPDTDTATSSDVKVVSTQPVEAETVTSDVVYVVRAGNTLATIAQAYGVTVDAIVEANDIQDPNAIYTGQELTIPDPALIPETVAVVVSVSESTESDTTVAAAAPALEWIEDTNPGPPFTIEVSANIATQDPLVEASRTYKVTGVVRNDGDQTYAVSALNITFYDAEGFRGIFVPAIREGEIVGGEWLWHGETEAEFAALLLAPGEEWPFEVEIVAQDMASFLIHPDATATDRESVSVALSDVQLVDEGTGYLRISGTATNTSAYDAKNVTVSGAIVDGNGKIVSVGSVYVLEEDIASGEAVAFDVRVAKEAYASYQVYAQAERDWE